MNNEIRIKRSSIYIKIAIIMMMLFIMIGISSVVQAADRHITYNEYNKSGNLFCLNKGYPFEIDSDFNKIFEYSVIDGRRTTIYDRVTGISDFEREMYNKYHQVSYLLSDVEQGRTRSDHNDDAIQMAFWRITSGNASGATFGNVDSVAYEEGSRLAACAMAYERYVNNRYVGVAPTINFAEYPVQYVEVGTETFIGPFVIQYPTEQLSYDAPNHQSYEGIYGEIAQFTVNGTEIAKTNFYDAAGQKLDRMLTFAGYPGNNQPFYLKASEAGIRREEAFRIDIKLNNQYRNAEKVIIWQSVTRDKSGTRVQTLLEGYGNHSFGDAFLEVPGEDRGLELSFTKENRAGERLNGAKFDVLITNLASARVINHSNSVPNSNGDLFLGDIVLEQLNITNIELKDKDKPISITLFETEAPEGCKKIEGNMYISLKVVNDRWVLNEDPYGDELVDEEEFNKDSVSIDRETGKLVSIKITNLPDGKVKLEFLKKNQKGEPLAEVGFRIIIRNVSEVNGTRTTNNTYNRLVYTEANGRLYLPGIVMAANATTIDFEITEEVAPPKYKPLEGTIYISLEKAGDGYRIKTKNATTDPTEFDVSRDIDESKLPEGFLTLNIRNTPENDDDDEGNLIKKDAITGDLIRNALFNITPTPQIISVTPTNEHGGLRVEWSNTWTVNTGSTTRTSSVTSPSSSSSSQTVNWRQTGYQLGSITVEETQAPRGYKKIEGAITVTVKRLGEATGSQSVSYSSRTAISCNCATVTHSTGYHGYNYYFNNPTTANVSNWTWTVTGYEKAGENIADTVLVPDEFRGWNVNAEGLVTLDIYNIPIPKIELDLIKINTSLINPARVANATFTATFVQQGMNQTTYTETTDGNGYVRFPAFQPDYITDVTLTIKEIERADGYKFLSSDVVVKFRFNKATCEWEIIDVTRPIDGEEVQTRLEKVITSNENKQRLTITIQDKSLIEDFTIIKLDSQTKEPVSGIEFKVTLKNVNEVKEPYARGDGEVTVNVTTDEQGRLSLKEIEIADVDRPIQIILEENAASVPKWYKVIHGQIIVNLERRGNTLINTGNSTTGGVLVPYEFDPDKSVTLDGHIVTVDIAEIPIIRIGGNVWLDEERQGDSNKQTVPPDGIMQEDEFRVQNIKVRLYTSDVSEKIPVDIYGNNIYGTNGQVLRDLYGNDLTNVKTDARGKYVFENVENANDYYVEFEYDGMNFEVTIKDAGSEPRINSHVSEVGRSQFNSKFEKIGGGTTNLTNSTGEALKGGIQLRYKEIEIKAATDKDPAYYESILITTKDPSYSRSIRHEAEKRLETGEVLAGPEPAEADYRMFAKTTEGIIKDTTKWKETWTDTSEYMAINMGLVERILMVSLMKDVWTADVSINGKTTTYTYNDLMMAEMLLSLSIEERLDLAKGIGNENSHDELKYNLFLQMSDYYFRVDDYVPNNNANQVNQIENLLDLEKEEDAELEILLTYYILLSNQTVHEGVRIDEVMDYYDEHLEYVSGSAKYYQFTGESANNGRIDLGIPEVRQLGTTEINPGDGTKTYNKMSITGLSKDLGEGGQQLIELTFRIKKEATIQGTPRSMLIEEFGKPEYRNIANISKYSTDEGYIDRKAATGTVRADNGQVHQTNHSDEAPGLVVRFNPNDRIINGMVWEDNTAEDNGYKHGNGIYDATERGIDDVIVQLIEVVEMNGMRYEYIWQEARTGNNTVKALRLNGESITNYNVSQIRSTAGAVSNEKGEYAFGAYIPGDYIIRYIYGDGTSYTVTPDVRDFNGNDYQSTIDERYKEPSFSYEYNKQATRKSDARDNEARRLEVMGKTALVGNDIGTKLDAMTNRSYADNSETVKAGLDLTWMCAETSTIDISLEEYDNYNNYLEKVIKGEAEPYRHYIANLDFGLQQRPVTLLELEKHVIGLNITIDGVRTILDVRAKDIDAVKAGEFDSELGITELAILGEKGIDDIHGAATRYERGRWYYQMDVEELGQAANLSATYQYTVHNKGDKDYLSKNLVELYEGLTIGEYIEKLVKYSHNPYLNKEELSGGFAYEVKSAIRMGTFINGTYLGTTYYTGNNRAGDTIEIPSRAEVLEEALNNELGFIVASGAEQGIDFKKVAGPETRAVYDVEGIWKQETINTIVQTKERTENLLPGERDNSNEIVLSRALSILNEDDELSYYSHIAEIFEYSNPAGRRDSGTVLDGSKAGGAIAGSLGNEEQGYVHSDDTMITLGRVEPVGRVVIGAPNEHDEFWAETIRITGPTGETEEIRAENETYTGIIVAIPALAILAISIVMISKIVLMKKPE